MKEVVEFLPWLATSTGATLAVLGLIGYMFREKWRQILARSLAADLERLKAQLQQESQAHAASLTPQIEAIKADFQQKLEAYKVSLIADAEHAKAMADVKKSIALKFVGIEFDRLVSLEKQLALINSEACSMGLYATANKTHEHWVAYLAMKQTLDATCDEASMFLDPPFGLKMAHWRKRLTDYAVSYIGLNKPVAPEAGQFKPLLEEGVHVTNVVRERIRAISGM